MANSNGGNGQLELMDDSHARELLLRAKNGDDAAREELVVGHLPIFVGLAFKYSNGHPERVDDYFQEAAKKLWQKATMYDGKSKFSTWAHKIGYNAMTDYYRKESRNLLHHDLDENGLESQLTSDEDIHRNVDWSNARERIMTAVEGLDPNKKDVILLFYFQGFSGPEIAQQLGIEYGTVKSRTSRGLQELREPLKDLRELVTTKTIEYN